MSKADAFSRPSRRSRWSILTAFSLTLLTLTCTLPVYSQYLHHGGNPGARPQWGQRLPDNWNGRWEQRNQQWNWNRRFNFTVVPANSHAFNSAQKQLRNDLEQFANQVALYFVIPGRPSVGGKDVQLVNELNALRQEVAVLIADSNAARPYQHWQMRVNQISSRAMKMDRLVAVAAPHPLTIQRWSTVRADVDKLVTALYWCGSGY